MKYAFSQMHWSRILLTGVLVVILVVILNTGSLVLANHVWSQPTAISISAWSTYLLLLLLTFGAAVWVAHTVEREPLLHGLLVGLVVGLIICLLSLGFGSPILRSLVTLVLNMATGFLGGFLGSRGRSQPAS